MLSDLGDLRLLRNSLWFLKVSLLVSRSGALGSPFQPPPIPLLHSRPNLLQNIVYTRNLSSLPPTSQLALIWLCLHRSMGSAPTEVLSGLSLSKPKEPGQPLSWRTRLLNRLLLILSSWPTSRPSRLFSSFSDCPSSVSFLGL